MRLTPGRINSATCPADKQQVILRDGEQPGLGLRVTVAGAKSFVYQGKLKGQLIRVTLGDVKTLGLSDARARAAKMRVMVLEGRDPRQVRNELAAADKAARKKSQIESHPALHVWAVYIEARTPEWSTRHKADHDTMAREGGGLITRGRRPGRGDKKQPGILRPLLELPLKDITCERVTEWVDVERACRPTRTRLALSLLGTFLVWCEDQTDYKDQVQPDACARMKKKLPKPTVKQDCLQKERLQLWFTAVRQVSNPIISGYLQILLLTGARRNELAALRWADVDFRWNSITLHDKADSKGGLDGKRTIPLTPYVKELLLGLPRVNEWVFFSKTSKSGHIAEPRIAHNKALTEAGLPPLTLHGLRRSFSTLAEWVEVPAGVAAQIMGHKPSAIAETL